MDGDGLFFIGASTLWWLAGNLDGIGGLSPQQIKFDEPEPDEPTIVENRDNE